jgi:transposase-like protein
MAAPKKALADRAPEKAWMSKPKELRFREALRRIENGVSVSQAARSMDLSRSQLNVRLAKARQEKQEAQARAAESLAGRRARAGNDIEVPEDGALRAPALGINERRRVGTFDEFDKRYFGNLVCPDCGVHHEKPGFHTEIESAVLDPDIRRCLINIPPYHAKSTVVTFKSTLYELVKDPNSRTIVVSQSQDFAKAFVFQLDMALSNPEAYANEAGNLIEDFGPFFGPGSQRTKSYLYVSGRSSTEKDPTVQALGIGNQIYGRRADRIIFDDIASVDNQRNPEQVLKQLEWIDKMALSRIGRTGKAIWVGTRISAGDIYTTLADREGYKVIKYPCILDEEAQTTLWQDHFPYADACLKRAEMRPEDWQVVYMNVDTPGLGSSFPAEVLNECKDTEHVLGQVDPRWRLFVGVDPAGGGKGSGFTAMVLLGWDRENQEVHLVDIVNTRSMKAYQFKDQLLDWADSYNLSEIRVESNGVQSQLVQYNQELMGPLAAAGVRVVPHHTHANKWDSQFGVEAIAPWFYNRKFFLPWGNADTQRRVQVLIDQLVGFPMAERSDIVMATWFSWLGVKESMKRQTGPMFEANRRLPAHVRRRQRVLDMANNRVWTPGDPEMPNFGRMELDVPKEKIRMMNTKGYVTVYG